MAKHEDHELRIMKVTGSLPPRQMRNPVPAGRPRTRPTRAEALDRLRSMKGANSVIERIPALGNTSAWGEVAFWSVNETNGEALHSGPEFWNCDFTGNWSVAFAYDNGYVMFWGTELLYDPPGENVEPPGNLTGQVWCELNVKVSGYYLFVAQVSANGDPPDYTAWIECGIDGNSLGQIELFAVGPYTQTFLVQLSPGIHRFSITQVKGILFFQSLTAWQIPILNA